MSAPQPRKHSIDAPTIEHSIVAARDGDQVAREELVESCRGYLLAIAQSELNQALRAKLGSSDVVQETLIKAHANFGTFRGQSKQELLGWMRQILLNDMANVRRHYQGAAKRDIDREAALDLFNSAGEKPLDAAIADGPTPGTAAQLHEQVIALREAMLRLPDDHRTVIQLRNWERLSFADVGQRLGRSEEAARKLWTRAISRLKEELVR